MRYVAFLRGVNVGGNALIKMADLRDALAAAGFQNVTTYIQSGNVLFDSLSSDKQQLARQMSTVIDAKFDLDISVALFTDSEWRAVIADAPNWWGQDPEWKHNILIMIEPYDMAEIVAAYGPLKSEIENMKPGAGVLYQSLSFIKFGRTTGGKIASSPIYKKMTIRNFNTATKLVKLLSA